MLKSIKYELKPTKSQVQKSNQGLGNCRFVYNWALDRKIKAYSKDKTSLSCFDLMKELTQIKKEEDFEWLNLSGSQQLQQSVSNLDKAFSNFFRAKKGFPKFKSKHKKQSFRIPQNVKVDYENYKFFVPKIGWIKFYKDKHIEGVIKFATISKTPTNRYFVSITFETQKKQKCGEGVVGIDLGIKHLAITSDGEVFENQKYLRQNLKKLKVKDLRVIGRFEPSSQTCNICGDRNKDLKLSDREWTCSNGHNLDRDLNAAINIKKFGLRASTLNVKIDH